MVLFPSLVNGKVANGGRENDRGNLGCSALGIPDPPRADPLARAERAERIHRDRNVLMKHVCNQEFISAEHLDERGWGSESVQ